MAIILGVLLMVTMAAAIVGTVCLSWREDAQDKANGLAHALSQFSQVVVSAADPRFALDTSTAQVISDTETHSRYRGSYIFTRIVRNECGEYFMLKSTAGAAPFVKHIKQEVARIVLKGKYSAPTTG